MRALLFIVLLSSSVQSFSQEYKLQVLQNQTYTEITNPTYEVRDTSIYFGNVTNAPDIVFPGFSRLYDLNDGLYIPLKQGYAYAMNNERSITMYFAKGMFKGLGNASSVFSFKTEGGAGTHVYNMQWKNMGMLNGASTDFINFQARLYESDGKIEIHFGPNTVTDSAWDNKANGPTIGLLEMDAAFSTIYSQIWLSGNSASPVLSNASGIVNLQNTPAPGTLYTFTYSPTGMKEEKANQLSAYPTIIKAGEELHINGLNNGSKLQIINALGNSFECELIKNKIQIPQVHSGLYFIKTERGSFKILIQ